jgi:deoxyribonuclease-4
MAPRIPDSDLPAPLDIPPDVLIGAHMSIAGGTWKAVERGERLGMTAIQLFVKNNNQWVGKALAEDEGEKFQAAESGGPTRHSFAHNCYLINMASGNDELRMKSIEAMLDELRRCVALGLPGLVAHPGAHVGDGEAVGVARIAAALDEIYDRLGEQGERVQVWLETTAGQGSSIGCRFEHLRDIIGAANCAERLAVCLDTAHVFAAGYDIRTDATYHAMWEEFDRVIGLDRLRAVHVNDSKKDLGTRVDRHAHLGQGFIGAEAFVLLMRDERLRRIPKVLETPKGDDNVEDWRNLALLLDALDGGDRLARIERSIAKLPGHDFSSVKDDATAKPGSAKNPAAKKPAARKGAAKRPAAKPATTKRSEAKKSTSKPADKKPAARTPAPKKPARAAAKQK